MRGRQGSLVARSTVPHPAGAVCRPDLPVTGRQTGDKRSALGLVAIALLASGRVNQYVPKVQGSIATYRRLLQANPLDERLHMSMRPAT